MFGEFFVFENTVGDVSSVHGGILEEFQPVVRVVRAFGDAERFSPFVQDGFVGGGRKDFALDLAPRPRVSTKNFAEEKANWLSRIGSSSLSQRAVSPQA